MTLNRYPRWKNLLLLVMLIIGGLYALPNVFGDYPAIQISGKNDAAVDGQIQAGVENALKKAHLPYQSALIAHKDLWIRFSNTDAQLKAKDIIKNFLGDDYTAALNLASATPAWLKSIGAFPMKLGLDLRGGVHFLLNVDVDSVIAHRQDANVSNLIAYLREKRVRYSDIRLGKDNDIYLSFRSDDQKKQALFYLRYQFPELKFTDIPNSRKISAALSPVSLQNVRQYALDQTMTTLRNRVNELGISEALVQQQGSSRVSVDMPGIQDTAHAKEILGGTATLEFRMADLSYEGHTTSKTAVNSVNPIDSMVYPWQGRNVLLKNTVILTGAAITDASASFDETGHSAVMIRLGGGGESLFHRVTADNIGNPLAVVYLETNFEDQIIQGKKVKIPKKTERIINIATIQSALGNSFQITGLSSSAEAKNLALLLRAGALPAAINYEEERTVGPTLGQENIQKGLLSVAAALSIIIIFMALYYSVFGIIADIALILNLVLLVALLSILGATLTLPGIAGIVLTLGLAVDANVLIFERIREELRLGMPPQASIHAGYERAFTTIVDANVTTLIVAMVLFSIGTDAVKGFAVTLTLGLLTSMVSGIMVTRALVNKLYGKRKSIKKLPVGI